MQKFYFDGRPAWYTNTGHHKEPYIIGVAGMKFPLNHFSLPQLNFKGGSASGKTSVCDEMIKMVGVRWVALICMDSFYKVLTPEQVFRFSFSCLFDF